MLKNKKRERESGETLIHPLKQLPSAISREVFKY